MRPLFETVTDLAAGADIVRARRYGIVVVAEGRLVAVWMWPLPKLLAWPEVVPVGRRYHARGPRDRCRLYYNQPWRFPNYLALRYVVSAAGTSLATFRAALSVLDAIAQIKGSDALLCDIANSRISARLMARWGWQAHKPGRMHRNYIKRFYGKYPPIDWSWASHGAPTPP
ncbi:MAG: hypothetical protein A2W31_05825 [Planctomycetes bacterium RBG_16_64_10]|nr:MAG: hypothetical protein A2W31_05825 [Planctomycetes bacterium RBG_16_64_10]